MKIKPLRPAPAVVSRGSKPGRVIRLLPFMAVLLSMTSLGGISGTSAESLPKDEVHGLGGHTGVAAEPAQSEGRGLATLLEKKQKELTEREAELVAKEERFKAVKADIEKKIEEFTKLKEVIEAFVKKLDEADAERTKKIVKIYESMPPEDVASRIEKLDEGMAVTILSSMSEKKAAKILAMVTVDKAVRLTERLRIRQH
ncbi:MAG: hypothetical protein HY887_02610 [Deltaproteobacteria bacterium]|nr:hypothetical protein [Deltaproteobacteria bacterium]